MVSKAVVCMLILAACVQCESTVTEDTSFTTSVSVLSTHSYLDYLRLGTTTYLVAGGPSVATLVFDSKGGKVAEMNTKIVDGYVFVSKNPLYPLVIHRNSLVASPSSTDKPNYEIFNLKDPKAQPLPSISFEVTPKDSAFSKTRAISMSEISFYIFVLTEEFYIEKTDISKSAADVVSQVRSSTLAGDSDSFLDASFEGYYFAASLSYIYRGDSIVFNRAILQFNKATASTTAGIYAILTLDTLVRDVEDPTGTFKLQKSQLQESNSAEIISHTSAALNSSPITASKRRLIKTSFGLVYIQIVSNNLEMSLWNRADLSQIGTFSKNSITDVPAIIQSPEVCYDGQMLRGSLFMIQTDSTPTTSISKLNIQTSERCFSFGTCNLSIVKEVFNEVSGIFSVYSSKEFEDIDYQKLYEVIPLDSNGTRNLFAQFSFLRRTPDKKGLEFRIKTGRDSFNNFIIFVSRGVETIPALTSYCNGDRLNPLYDFDVSRITTLENPHKTEPWSKTYNQTLAWVYESIAFISVFLQSTAHAIMPDQGLVRFPSLIKSIDSIQYITYLNLERIPLSEKYLQPYKRNIASFSSMIEPVVNDEDLDCTPRFSLYKESVSCNVFNYYGRQMLMLVVVFFTFLVVYFFKVMYARKSVSKESVNKFRFVLFFPTRLASYILPLALLDAFQVELIQTSLMGLLFSSKKAPQVLGLIVSIVWILVYVVYGYFLWVLGKTSLEIGKVNSIKSRQQRREARKLRDVSDMEIARSWVEPLTYLYFGYDMYTIRRSSFRMRLAYFLPFIRFLAVIFTQILVVFVPHFDQDQVNLIFLTELILFFMSATVGPYVGWLKVSDIIYRSCMTIIMLLQVMIEMKFEINERNGGYGGIMIALYSIIILNEYIWCIVLGYKSCWVIWKGFGKARSMRLQQVREGVRVFEKEDTVRIDRENNGLQQQDQNEEKNGTIVKVSSIFLLPFLKRPAQCFLTDRISIDDLIEELPGPKIYDLNKSKKRNEAEKEEYERVLQSIATNRGNEQKQEKEKEDDDDDDEKEGEKEKEKEGEKENKKEGEKEKEQPEQREESPIMKENVNIKLDGQVFNNEKDNLLNGKEN